MPERKVVVLALHDELESVYPPLNIAVGAASSGADVILAFSRKGGNILTNNFVPKPSKGIEYLSQALDAFNAPTINELVELAAEAGVRFYIVDADHHEKLDLIYPAEQVPIKWVLNESNSADLFVHF